MSDVATSERTDGGPAFPAATYIREEITSTSDDGCRTRHEGYRYVPEPVDGLSLLDYFAGQALAGLSAVACSPAVIESFRLGGKSPSDLSSSIVVQAYSLADGMIRERNRRALP